MSKLQHAIISSYKEKYPTDKLRHISEKTSIQITRVFRILNGSEMKISEYEAFENCLEMDQKHTDILEDLKSILSEVSHDKKSFLKLMIQKEAMKLKIAQRTKGYRSHFKEALC